VLLPWVEEQRQELLQEVQVWLPKSDQYSESSLEEMEVGALDYSLGWTAAPQALRNRVSLLKRTRNIMAHCGTLNYRSLMDLARLERA
jgi:hypothetical protein